MKPLLIRAAAVMGAIAIYLWLAIPGGAGSRSSSPIDPARAGSSGLQFWDRN